MKTLTLTERLLQKQQEDMALIENQTQQKLQHFTDSLNKNVESELNIIKKISAIKKQRYSPTSTSYQISDRSGTRNGS